MLSGTRFAAAAVLILAVPASGGGRIDLSSWPEGSRLLAAATLREYGEPDAVFPARLAWRARRPWSRIEVFRDARSAEHPDRILQALPYEVPPRRWRDLNAFDRGATYDPVRRELVARTDSEAGNLLALNLADEVVQERRTPQEAEEFFDETMRRLAAGESSSYAARLMFSPALRTMTAGEERLGEDLLREIQVLQQTR